MTKKLSYSGAREIRQSGISNQIAERLLSGESVSSSFSKSISESMMSKMIGLKEKFDPLNIAKILTGGSALGPALLGKMMGRSNEDISHFAGSGKAKQKKDPMFLSVVKRTPENIRVNDTFADSLGKLYTLFKSIDDEEKLTAQLKKDLQQEKIEEEQRRNEEVLRQIKKVAMKAKRINDKARKQSKKTEKTEQEQREESSIFRFDTETASRIPGVVKGVGAAIGAGIAGYGLSKLLKKGEAATYNTIFGGKEVPLDKMTINEVLQFQNTMKGGSTAVGKYQIIKSTLIEAKKNLNLTGNEIFDSETQDRIYNEWLIGGKRQSVRDYISGETEDVKTAALDLAKEFASFPVVERTFRPATKNWPAAWIEPGESYYKGVGSNPTKASISVNQVISGLQEERQIRTGQKTIDSSGKLAYSDNVISNINNTTNNIENVITPNINNTTKNTKVNSVENNTIKNTNKVSMQTDNKDVGSYMNNIFSQNKEVKENNTQNRLVSNVGNNLNFVYRPGDNLVYNITSEDVDFPSILRK